MATSKVVAILQQYLRDVVPTNPQMDAVGSDHGLIFKDVSPLSSDSELDDILHPEPCSDVD